MRLTKPAAVGFQVIGFALIFLAIILFFGEKPFAGVPFILLGGWMVFQGGKTARMNNRDLRRH